MQAHCISVNIQTLAVQTATLGNYDKVPQVSFTVKQIKPHVHLVNIMLVQVYVMYLYSQLLYYFLLLPLSVMSAFVHGQAL